MHRCFAAADDCDDASRWPASPAPAKLAYDKSHLFQAFAGDGQLLFKDLVDGKTNAFVAVGTDALIDRYSGEQAAFTRRRGPRAERALRRRRQASEDRAMKPHRERRRSGAGVSR
ncbi:hypothetical protein [Dokdonella sp.]|uniref:hypothetical protein n=1 Tax=Dokdonella sp. TaxID=2291710 RepID=UPI002F3E51D5